MPLQRRFALVVGVMILTACSTVTPITPPEPELSHDVWQADEMVSTAAWWDQFDDPHLSQLIEQALANNFTLQATLARLEQSMASARQAGSERMPELSASAGQRQRWQQQDGQNSDRSTWQASLDMRYELDVWGRIRSLHAQGQFNLLSQQARVHLQHNTIASQVAMAWYGWQKERELLALLQQQEQRLQSALTAIERRFSRGQVAVADVWQQQQLLAANQLDQANAHAQMQLHRQRLALWLGRHDVPIAHVSSASLALPEATTSINTAQLRLRPDVQVALYELQAVNAALAVAVANRYPRFSITASIGSEEDQLSGLFSNWFANLAANLVLPLVDGGSRRAEVARQQARVDELLAQYQQVWLEAAVDVQQALIQQQLADQRAALLASQLQLAEQTESFQQGRYRNGVGDYLSLLTAQRAVLILEQQLLANRLQQVQHRIELYTALSSGERSTAEETAL